MRKLIMAVFCLAASTSLFGQPSHSLPTVDDKINFSEIVTVDGVPKAELYSRAKLWFANAFNSSNHVIQLDDSENGIILGKGTAELEEHETISTTKKWNFTVKIQMKDFKYKVELYDIDYTFINPEFTKVTGLQPRTHDLDVFFADRKMYDKTGGLKKGAPTNIANWTTERFTAMLASIKKSLSQTVRADDF